MRAAALVALLLAATPAMAQNVDVRIRPDVPAKRCGALDYLMIPTLGVAPKCQARAAAADRKAVTDLMAQGKCKDAVPAALRLGDLSFAREVKAFCEQPSPAPAVDPASPPVAR